MLPGQGRVAFLLQQEVCYRTYHLVRCCANRVSRVTLRLADVALQGAIIVGLGSIQCLLSPTIFTESYRLGRFLFLHIKSYYPKPSNHLRDHRYTGLIRMKTPLLGQAPIFG